MVYDLIIVGAGPAGGMLARSLSPKKYNICLIDKKKEVGLPVRCGEAISRFALEANGLEMDKHWVKWKAQGIKMFCPNGKFFYATTDSHLSIDRARFDRWLVEQATGNGVDLFLNTRVKGAEKVDRGWRVKTDKGNFQAKILVAADGSGSEIARWTGLLKRREYLKALQFTFRSGEGERFADESLCVYKRDTYNPGYIWVFPRGDGYNVGIGGKGPLLSLLRSFCASLGFAYGGRQRVTAGIIPRRYDLEAYARDGLMVVGDAAGLTNPIHGGGLYQALLSGRLAAEAAVRALDEDSLSLLTAYDANIRRHPICDPRLYRASRIMEFWKDGHFNLAGTLFEGKTLSISSKAVALNKLIRHPSFVFKIPEFLEAIRAFDLIREGW